MTVNLRPLSPFPSPSPELTKMLNKDFGQLLCRFSPGGKQLERQPLNKGSENRTGHGDRCARVSRDQIEQDLKMDTRRSTREEIEGNHPYLI